MEGEHFSGRCLVIVGECNSALLNNSVRDIWWEGFWGYKTQSVVWSKREGLSGQNEFV